MPETVPQLLTLLAVAKSLCVSRPKLGETGQAETRPAVPSAAVPS
jgi:hypothetical protein